MGYILQHKGQKIFYPAPEHLEAGTKLPFSHVKDYRLTGKQNRQANSRVKSGFKFWVLLLPAL